MAKFSEVVYACVDINKLLSDDSTLTDEHALFLLCKYRNYILNQYFKTPKQRLSDANYQTICIDMEPYYNEDTCCSTPMLRSVNPIPYTMTIGHTLIEPPAGWFCSKFTFVDYMQFRFSGYNKYLKKVLYATLGPDRHVYIKSNNGGFELLRKIRMTAIFDDIQAAAMLECNEHCENDPCDVMEHRFPIEDSFIPGLLKAVQQDVIRAALTPRDIVNDAADGQDTMAQVIASYLNTAGKRLLKGGNDGEDESSS